MKILKKISLFIIFLGVFFTFEVSYAEGLGFSVFIQKPENQIDTKTPYLDLRMKPLETTELKVTVRNESKENPLFLDFNYVNATTNSEGRLEYSSYHIANDSSLKNKFEAIISGPEKEELAPNEEKTMIFKLTMPEEEYDGFIAGGIEILQSEGKEGKANKEASMTTEFSYVIGMKISENDNEVKNEIEFKKIQLELYNNKDVLMAYFANVTSSYVEDLELTVDISTPGKNNKLMGKKAKHMRMAPNSQIAFPIEFPQKKLKNGVYEAHIEGKTKDGFSKNWKHPFKLSTEGTGYVITEVEEVTTKVKKNTLFVIILVVLFIIILLVMILILRRRKNERK